MSKKTVKNSSRPATKTTEALEKTLKVEDKNSILSKNSPFSFKEAYNKLRTNIIFSIPSDGCKIVGVTSAERAEGKSTNALNMAINFAESNAKVLLIDCDLRKPKIGRLLDMKPSPGIASVLVGVHNIKKAIRKTKYENLSVLLSGGIHPNPTELLISAKFEALIKELSSDFDYIFVDTPPVNVVADASIISKHLTGYVFVVRQGVSERDSVKNALEQLSFVNAKIFGFLLNSVPSAGKSYRKKYKRYGYYSYGYGYGRSIKNEEAVAVSSSKS